MISNLKAYSAASKRKKNDFSKQLDTRAQQDTTSTCSMNVTEMFEDCIGNRNNEKVYSAISK